MKRTIRADAALVNDEFKGEVVSRKMLTKPRGLELAPNAKNTHVKLWFYDGSSVTLLRDEMIEVERP